MSSELAIALRGISKCFRIYDTPANKLKESLAIRVYRLCQPLLRRLPSALQFRPTYSSSFWALQNISVDVRRGETLGIIGLNGSGKSTLLQIIAGTMTPTTGEVTVSGRIATLLELGSGFNPEFTGRENIYINGMIMGLTRAEITARFSAITAFADIGDFVDQPIKTYSSGMILRLAFAVIANVDADVLVIDEALAVGDFVFAQKCMRFLREFKRKGSIILVSHDSSAVVSLCDRALWLQSGTARMIGDAKTVSEAYFGDSYSHMTPADREASVHATPQGDRPQGLESPQLSAPPPEAAPFSNEPNHVSFGKGGAWIDEVVLLNDDGQRIHWVSGGESVRLRIRAVARTPLFSPIIGFYVKDRLGQFLFGDNTFLSFRDNPCHADRDELVEAIFSFTMPLLTAGDYSICVAIAEGSQHEHLQHHWIHDAILFKSHSNSACTGLVGIPMDRIKLQTIGRMNQNEYQQKLR